MALARALAQLSADVALAVSRELEARGHRALAMRLHEWALSTTGALTPVAEEVQRLADEEDKLH
jgi:hypothetical protein